MAENSVVSKEDRQLAGLTQALSEENAKPSRGLVKRIWSAMGLVGHIFFKSSKEDFEKRLQHLSKEEVAARSRLKQRTQFWRKFARAIILYSVIGEILVLGIAIYSTRNVHMAWQTRAWRVLPVFVLPLITTLVYSSCASLYRMRERKDQKTLERLTAERKEKIDELKEKTNYYLTQQLIQKYDMDPAAKAAAASVLASKLGSESGLKFALQVADNFEKEDADKSASGGQNNDMEATDSTGLRNRRSLSRKASQVDRRTSFGQGNRHAGYNESVDMPRESSEVEPLEQPDEVEHYRGKPSEGGWIARLAAMLVGEDPSQCYALICGKCHVHNGLAKKEDYEYITYYCPHCGALNKSNHLEDGDANDRPEGTPTNPGPPREGILSISDDSPERLSQEVANSEDRVTSAFLATIQEPLENETTTAAVGS